MGPRTPLTRRLRHREERTRLRPRYSPDGRAREHVPMFGNLGRTLERRAGRLIFGSRRWVEAQLRELAPEVHSARILEIGSGRQDMGEDAYSFRRLFDDSNEFVRSDVEPDHGHLVVDVTTMEFDAEWDLILCVSVLEHVPDFKAAAERMHRALRPGGRAVIVAPMCFPYHDEPYDYWRFTVHGVRNMLRHFDSVDVRSRGPRRLPFTTLAVARRATEEPSAPTRLRSFGGALEGLTAEA